MGGKTLFRSAAKVIKAFFIGYSTPGITRSTPQGYVPVLTNHWLRFKIVSFSHLMIIGKSTCDVTRVARHSTIVVKVLSRATLLLVRKIQTLTEEPSHASFYEKNLEKYKFKLPV